MPYRSLRLLNFVRNFSMPSALMQWSIIAIISASASRLSVPMVSTSHW